MNISGIYLREDYYTKLRKEDEAYTKPQKSLIEQSDLKQNKDIVLKKKEIEK